MTTRQYIALRLYYCEGWSYGKIGAAFGVSRQSVYRIILRGQRWAFEHCIAEGGDTSLLVRGLFAPSPSSSLSRNVGLAVARQDELLDALELRMEREAVMAASLTECMSGDSHLPTHVKRNSFDQWELRYLNVRAGRRSVPSTAYKALNVAANCSCDERMCGLQCVGCHGAR